VRGRSARSGAGPSVLRVLHLVPSHRRRFRWLRVLVVLSKVAALNKPKLPQLQPTAPAPELASLEIKIIGRLVSSR